MAIQNLPRSVKTLQHPKALGNARQVVRGTYHLIYSDVSDLRPVADTAFGMERNAVGSTGSLAFDGTYVVGAGRLEPVSEEMKALDSRIADKEAYRLFWLPYAYGLAPDLEAQRDGNQSVTTPIDESNGTGSNVELLPGVRVWINIKAEASTTHPNDEEQVYLDAFIVVENAQPNLGDILEFPALIVRDKTQSPRTLTIA